MRQPDLLQRIADLEARLAFLEGAGSQKLDTATLDADTVDTYHAAQTGADAHALVTQGDGGAILTGDLYAEANDAALLERLDGYRHAVTHFDGGAIPAGWAWAGSPFVTPNTVVWQQSYVRAMFDSSQSTPRAFLYKSGSSDGTARAALVNAVTDYRCGLRIDDGSDNNYREVVLRKVAGTDAPSVYTRTRTGGGAITEAAMAAGLPPYSWIGLGYYVYGTQWSAWDISALVNITAPMGTEATLNWPGSQTWTPSRVGIVFIHPSASPNLWEGAVCDYWGDTI